MQARLCTKQTHKPPPQKPMEHFAELVSFISNPSEAVRTTALSGMLGYCRDEPYISFIISHTHYLAILCDLTCDPHSHVVRKLALACLITLTSGCKVIVNADEGKSSGSGNAPPTVDGHHAIFEQLIVECKAVQRLAERLVLMMREDNKLRFSVEDKSGDSGSSGGGNGKGVDKTAKENNEERQLVLVLLSTLTQTEQGQRQLLQIPLLKRETQKKTQIDNEDDDDDEEEEDDEGDEEEEEVDDLRGFYVQKLVELLEYVPVKMGNTTSSDELPKELEEKIQKDPTKWIPNILTNIATLEEGRDHMLLETDVDTLRRVLLYARDVNPIKRNGIVTLIQNCLYDRFKHSYLVEKVDVVDLLLDRIREEEQTAIRKIIIESLWMCTVSTHGLDALGTSPHTEVLDTIVEKEADTEMRETLEKIIAARNGRRKSQAERQPEGVVMPEGVTEGDLVAIDPDTQEVKLIAKGNQSDQNVNEQLPPPSQGHQQQQQQQSQLDKSQ